MSGEMTKKFWNPWNALGNALQLAAALLFVLFASITIHVSGLDKVDDWPSEKELLANNGVGRE